MSEKADDPVALPKGGNVGLRALDAELGSVTIILETGAASHDPVDADVSVLLLDENGRVRSNDDFIFYNQPIALDGAVHLRDKIRSEPDDNDVVLSTDILTLELDDVPESISRIVIAASLDPETAITFGDARFVQLRLQRTSDASDLLVYRIEDAQSERALMVGELYRRAGEWRLRAIGQGYSDGLAGLATEFGIDVDSSTEDAGVPEPTAAHAEPEAEGASSGLPAGTDRAESDARPDSASDVAAERSAPARRLTVRRNLRAPKMPADWNRTIPMDGEVDWQPARLFPVAGIGMGEEQERRATSSLLAVMSLVRDFGRALIVPLGAPAGLLETFVEVPFGHDDKAFRPDGVIRVTRGQKVWTALVEVKTSAGELQQSQIDAYVDIARAKGLDAVLTISNHVPGNADEHPVAIDRRKLRKLSLRHLSWDEIRTQAIIATRHRGIADPAQRYVLSEFIRYMEHPRSGLHGFANMGPQWVKVREDVKTRTLRSADRHAAEVTAMFAPLVASSACSSQPCSGCSCSPSPPATRATPLPVASNWQIPACSSAP